MAALIKKVPGKIIAVEGRICGESDLPGREETVSLAGRLKIPSDIGNPNFKAMVMLSG